MNTNVVVGVRGKYLFRDPKTKKVVREVKNLITDWGMKRMVGFNVNYAGAFAENFKHLVLGFGGLPESPSDFELNRYHAPGPTTFSISHCSLAPAPDPKANLNNPANWINTFDYSSDTSLVGTEYDTTPTGDLIIRFNNSWDLKFNATIAILEMGVSWCKPEGSDDAPNEEWSHSHSLPNYAGTIAVASSPNGGPGTRWRDAATRLTYLNDINYSLFSRATIHPSALYNKDDETTITYVCEVVLCKETLWKENMLLDTSSLTSVSPSDQLPPNKTGIRQCPFYKLGGNGLPLKRFWGSHYGGGNKSYPVGAGSRYEPDTGAQVIPVFDCQGTKLNARGVWTLDFYEETGVGFNYSSIYNTITADELFDSTVTGRIPNPIESQSIKRYFTGSPGIPPRTESWIYREYPASITVQPVVGSGGNQYETKIRFLIRTNTWRALISGNVYSWSLNRFINGNQQIPYQWRQQSGITTFMNAAYSPGFNRFIGLDYKFVWTRI